MIDQAGGGVHVRGIPREIRVRRRIGLALLILVATVLVVMTVLVVPQLVTFGLLAAMVITSLAGVAICAVSPPLPNFATVSILASRVSWLVKATLAMMVLPYTSMVVWLVGDLLEGSATSGTDLPGGVGALFSGILFPGAGLLVFAAVLWLAQDLIRLGKRRRRNAVDCLLRVVTIPPGALRRNVRSLTLGLVSTWWWTVTAFVFAPFLLLAIISQLVTT